MKKYRIGLEISPHQLGAAVAAKQKNGWRIIETLHVPIAANTIQQSLKQVRASIARSIQQTVFGLAYHQVLMKEIRLDATLTDAEVYHYLQQQASTLFGKPANHWFLDFERLQSGYRVVAGLKQTILAGLTLCRESGFRVSAVDVEVLALARLMPTLAAYHPDQLQGLLWLKPTEALFIVAQTGKLIYAKTAPYCASTQTIAETVRPLLQFFNALYPQQSLANVLLISEESTPPLPEEFNIKIAELNPNLWGVTKPVQAQALCSLGLAIYGY